MDCTLFKQLLTNKMFTVGIGLGLIILGLSVTGRFPNHKMINIFLPYSFLSVGMALLALTFLQTPENPTPKFIKLILVFWIALIAIIVLNQVKFGNIWFKVLLEVIIILVLKKLI